MKKMLLLTLIVTLGSCEPPKPEFYINGKPYYTESRCINTKYETVWEYHYGYNYFNGKFEFHYGPNTKSWCVEWVVDTIEIKH